MSSALRHAIVGRHHPRDSAQTSGSACAPSWRRSVVPLLCHDPPLGVDDEDRGLRIGRSDAGRADIPAGTRGFILLLGVTTIAAPGPGGDCWRRWDCSESMLGFDETLAGLMIATYIAMDSFGTATVVTGDGAVAVIVDAIDRRSENENRTKFSPGPPKAAFSLSNIRNKYKCVPVPNKKRLILMAKKVFCTFARPETET